VAAGETTSVLLELGWPAKALSPNSREHFMTKWRYAKASKDTAFWATRASLGHAELKHDGKTRIAVVITAYPPDERDRDSDNLLASCKACLDGIALALKVNDSFFDPRVQWGEPVPNGKLVIEVRS
jgi:crossover junction endodeoxyribonuclease RusA